MARNAGIPKLVLAAGANDRIERGALKLRKGEKAMGLRVRISGNVTNTTGGSIGQADFSALLVEAILDRITIKRLDYGHGGKYGLPYVERSLKSLLRHAQRCYGPRGDMTELTKALATIANAATGAFSLDFMLPLGKWAAFKGADKDLFGMGRSQLATVYVEIERSGSTAALITGVTLSGNLTLQFDPDTVPCDGDVWNPVPHLHKAQTVRDEIDLPAGLPLALEDEGSLYPLTNFSLFIDDYAVHEQASIEQATAEILTRITTNNAGDVAQFVAAENYHASLLFDASLQYTRFNELRAGVMRFVQNVRDQSDFEFEFTYLPLRPLQSSLRAETEHAAKELRRKRLKVVSERGVPSPSLAPYSPVRLVDVDDADFARKPGYVADSSRDTTGTALHVPATFAEQSRAAYEKLKSNGEGEAARKLADNIAATVPDTVRETRGFGRGDTSRRSEVRAQLGLV